MTPHNHREIVPGCYRCELGRDEAESGAALERLSFALDRDRGLLDPDDPRYDPLVAARWDGV